MKRMLYLAYGSNLNVEQMGYRCPDAIKIGKTIISDYKLNFRGTRRGYGFANIERAKGNLVGVGIWAISKADEESLDMYEGYPTLYMKTYLDFPYAGKIYTGLAYIMRPGHPVMEPAKWYEDTIREGYQDFKMNTMALDKVLRNVKYEKAKDEYWRIYYTKNGEYAGYTL